MMPIRTAALALALALATLSACRPDDQRTESIRADDVRQARENLPSAVVVQLDSGNAAYRAHDFSVALRHYRTAVEADSAIAAGWFGVYMAQRALGDFAAAEQAMERARSLAPGATLVHPAGEDTLQP